MKKFSVKFIVDDYGVLWINSDEAPRLRQTGVNFDIMLNEFFEELHSYIKEDKPMVSYEYKSLPTKWLCAICLYGLAITFTFMAVMLGYLNQNWERVFAFLLFASVFFVQHYIQKYRGPHLIEKGGS